MCIRDSIHDVHVAERGQLAGHVLVILLFALVEAHVLAQDAFAGLYADAVQIVLLKPDRNAEQFLKAFGHGSQRSFFGVNAFFGTAKVREHRCV